jgi:type VI secretion system protein ImpL
VRIKPTAGISRIILEVGGQQVVYRNEPERWVSLRWPGEKKGAFLRAFGKTNEETIPEEGDWGFFHLLDDGKVIEEDDHLSVVWKLRGMEGELRMDIRPVDIWKPFRGFTVPRAVAHGPTPCTQSASSSGGRSHGRPGH